MSHLHNKIVVIYTIILDMCFTILFSIRLLTTPQMGVYEKKEVSKTKYGFSNRYFRKKLQNNGIQKT